VPYAFFSDLNEALEWAHEVVDDTRMRVVAARTSATPKAAG
jgi:hypothetical protein